MPDWILLIVALMAIAGAIGSMAAMKEEPSWFFAILFFAGVAFLDIKWWVHAYGDWKNNNVSSLVASFEIQTMTDSDGSQHQIYYDYNSGTIHNVTERWKKFVPEGTMVMRYERQNKWGGGVRFSLPDYKYDELRMPLDDRWEGPPNERIENGN